jgi:hypothetical protein
MARNGRRAEDAGAAAELAGRASMRAVTSGFRSAPFARRIDVATAHPSSAPAKSGTGKVIREVDGIFVARDALDRSVAALAAAGFDHSDMTVVLERRFAGGKTEPVAEAPGDGFSATDQRQLRTLGTSLAGAVAALATVGIVAASGGTALAIVGAAAAVGTKAALGVHIFKTSLGFDGSGPGPDQPSEDIILTVRVPDHEAEQKAATILVDNGAWRVWAQNRPY